MKKICVLVSGGGTNLQALIDAEKSGIIKNGKITCVISSKEGAYALERAKNAGIGTVVIPRKEYADSKSYSEAILAELNRQGADLIVLAGFMIILDECVSLFVYKMYSRTRYLYTVFKSLFMNFKPIKALRRMTVSVQGERLLSCKDKPL